MNDRCNNWDIMTPVVVFSMNNAVNSSTGYSPFEILYVQRPKFPLSPCAADMKSVPKDYHAYMNQKRSYLGAIRDDVKENIMAQSKMLVHENAKAGNLMLSKGDYVYMTDESQGQAKKLNQHYAGPFVVQAVPTVHTVILEDPETKESHPQPVHIDRLKLAYNRQPTPFKCCFTN